MILVDEETDINRPEISFRLEYYLDLPHTNILETIISVGSYFDVIFWSATHYKSKVHHIVEKIAQKNILCQLFLDPSQKSILHTLEELSLCNEVLDTIYFENILW